MTLQVYKYSWKDHQTHLVFFALLAWVTPGSEFKLAIFLPMSPGSIGNWRKTNQRKVLNTSKEFKRTSVWNRWRSNILIKQKSHEKRTLWCINKHICESTVNTANLLRSKIQRQWSMIKVLTLYEKFPPYLCTLYIYKTIYFLIEGRNVLHSK